MRDIILRAVEKADGWQFIPSHSFIKVPGFTEPADILRMSPVVLSGLVDQIVSQIDKSENFFFHSNQDGRAVVINISSKGEEPSRSSYHGDTRSINALKAIDQSKFLG